MLFKQNPSNSKMLLVDSMVLFGSSVPCSNLTLMTSNADATGIHMNSAVTSNDVIQSPSSYFMFLISSAKSLLLFTW